MTIELATSFMFLVTSLYGSTATSAIINNNRVVKADPNQPKQEIAVSGPATLEEYVKNYFKDEPILADIAGCESRYHQFKNDGEVMRGVNPDDIGIMQINEKYQAKQAKKNGFDIYTLEGNMAYAKWLYDKEGTAPWMSSSKCWKNDNKDVAIATKGVNQN